ncbi:MAG: hypothetical protein ACM3XM_04750 [Mycobacterium leprae]
MEKRQTLIWTALPNGHDADSRFLYLSAFLSPRLWVDAPETKLAYFHDWVDWPSSAPARFTIEIESGEYKSKIRVRVASRQPNPTLWQALFSTETCVRSYGYTPMADRKIRSYRVAPLLSHLKACYQSIATESPADFPSMARLREQFGPISFPQQNEEAYLERLRAEKVVTPDQPFDILTDLLRARLFHQGPSGTRLPVTVPRVDFHDMVGTLGQYPELMRSLGLVYDLEVKMPRAVPIPPEGLIRVVPVWSSKDDGCVTESVMPWTHYVLNSPPAEHDFRAAPRPGTAESIAPLLPVDQAKAYQVVQVDVDGLALKSLGFARSLSPLASSPFSPVTGEQRMPAAPLPALTSTGLSIVRSHRAYHTLQQLAESRSQNDLLEGGHRIELWANDLIRGYRVDVWWGRWFSLHQRVGTYDFTRPESPQHITYTDEGWVSSGATSSPDPACPNDLYLHESLFHWEGWSLSAPRPDKAVTPDEQVADGENQPATDFRLAVRMKPRPGSLPKLRFGRTYRLRVRTVDLAGNGPAFEPESTPDSGHVTPAIRYGRYEPVPQPVLIPPTEALKPAESVAHLVLRSWSTPPAGTPATEGTERLVAPPVADEWMVERHGMLDALRGGFQPDAYRLLTEREGALPDPMACGAALQELPGSAEVVRLPFAEGRWPDHLPFRLLLKEGSGAPQWLPADRVLVVELPRATVAKVRLSSYLRAEDLRQMGLWQWITERLPEGDPRLDALRKTAEQGRHWMLTPFRELTLVHAVQQPLERPAFGSIVPLRSPGQASADLNLNLHVDGKSTGKVELHARWDEMRDDLAQPGPTTMANCQAHPCDLAVDPRACTVRALKQHAFGDTRHRLVHYSASALTRFPEYFPAGTTPLTLESEAELDVHIPASAHPDKPALAYVVPTFAWEFPQDTLPGQIIHRRKGGGLRVYLERPWYSSGDDEKLGVVLAIHPRPGTVWTLETARQMIERFQTQIAEDPIHPSPPTQTALQAANFRLATATAANLPLAEAPGCYAAVAAHEVAYDPDRRLWYCDLQIDPSADSAPYFPFIKLALVRYQPYAILSPVPHNLSPVLLADFIQLIPDRTLSVAPSLRDKSSLALTLAGPMPPWTAMDQRQPRHKVEVAVEHPGPIAGPLGWTRTGEPIPLIRQRTGEWSAEVPIPSTTPPVRTRLVIREYERITLDAPDRQLERDRPVSAWRLVFADEVML